jgi:Fe-Mn family superoxide dismutase
MIIRNNGGGHYNHSLFWKFMSPEGGSEPTGPLADGLKEKYGDFQKFIDAFSEKAVGVFGSGWAWLQPDLTIVTTPNQDSPLTNSDAAEPILGLDVWEHAYYLDYTYRRADYVKAWWHVVNWPEVEQRFIQNKS